MQVYLRARDSQGTGRDGTAGKPAAMIEEHRDIRAAFPCVPQTETDRIPLIMVVEFGNGCAGVVQSVGGRDGIGVIEKCVQPYPFRRCDLIREFDAVNSPNLEIYGGKQ